MPSPNRLSQSRFRQSFSGHSLSVPLRDPRTLDPLWVGLALALTFALLSPAFAHGQLSVTSFDPPVASPGTAITLEGSGFIADSDAQAAFVIDPLSDSGALIELGSATPTQLEGVLGPAASPFTGQVRVWSGTCWQLPGGLHRGQWATYLVREAEWFVPSAVAQARDAMVVTHPSPGALEALRTSHSLIIPFDDWPTDGDTPECGIDLDILVDGGTASGDDGGPDGGGSARLLSTGIVIVEQHLAYDPALLVSDLAPILESTYGALGLHFTAMGTDLHVTWEKAPVLHEGFAVLSLGKKK